MNAVPDTKFLRDQFWHLLCHRQELPAPGMFLKLHWLDEEVVVFNDGGDMVVFDNLCPHRGMRFFTEDSGTGAISCSYHGWTYCSGKMHIPVREQYAESDLKRARLNVLKTEWCGDFLFVSIAPRLTIDEQLGETFDLLASISFEISGRADFDAYTFECDWRIAIENALEPLHVPYVHSDSLGQLKLSEGQDDLHAWSSVWYSSVENERMLKQLRSIKKLFRIEHQHEGYMSIYLFPFTMLSSTFGYSYSLQNFFPADRENRTHFSSRLLTATAKSAATASALEDFFKSSAETNRKIFNEDHEICKRVSPKVLNMPMPSILSSSEIKLAHFRRCIESALSEQ